MSELAGLREGELNGLEWRDYVGEALAVNRSIGRSIVNPLEAMQWMQASLDVLKKSPAIVQHIN